MKRCAVCGQENDDWRPFCTRCGASYARTGRRARARRRRRRARPRPPPPVRRGRGCLRPARRARGGRRRRRHRDRGRLAVAVGGRRRSSASPGWVRRATTGRGDHDHVPGDLGPAGRSPSCSSTRGARPRLHAPGEGGVPVGRRLQEAGHDRRQQAHRQGPARSAEHARGAARAGHGAGQGRSLRQGEPALGRDDRRVLRPRQEGDRDPRLDRSTSRSGSPSPTSSRTRSTTSTSTSTSSNKIGDQHDTDAVDRARRGRRGVGAEQVRGDALRRRSPRPTTARSRPRSARATSRACRRSSRSLSEWPYDFGPLFVDILREVGGQARVDRGVQVAADRRGAGDRSAHLSSTATSPGPISAPTLPRGAKKLDSGKEFGALAWYLDAVGAHRPARRARRPTLGWGADSYVDAREGTKTCVEVHYRGETKQRQHRDARPRCTSGSPRCRRAWRRVTSNADNTLHAALVRPGCRREGRHQPQHRRVPAARCSATR